MTSDRLDFSDPSSAQRMEEMKKRLKALADWLFGKPKKGTDHQIFGRAILFALTLVLAWLYYSTSTSLFEASYCEGSEEVVEVCQANAKGLSDIHNSVQGLISAVVIAAFAITKPGQSPALTKEATNLQKIAILAYIGLWAYVGVRHFQIGIQNPPEEVLASVTEYATTWVGLVISAVGAYLGIDTD